MSEGPNWLYVRLSTVAIFRIQCSFHRISPSSSSSGSSVSLTSLNMFQPINPVNHQPSKLPTPQPPPQHLDTELRINGGDFASLVAFFALHKALRDLDSGRNDSLEGWEFLGKTWRILSGKKNTTITLGKTTWWICFFCWY